MSDLLKQTPIYVSRETSNGAQGSLWLALWVQISLLALAVFNGLGWGVYGLIELASKVL
jgi:hypothetical protein